MRDTHVRKISARGTVTRNFENSSAHIQEDRRWQRTTKTKYIVLLSRKGSTALADSESCEILITSTKSKRITKWTSPVYSYISPKRVGGCCHGLSTLQREYVIVAGAV